MPPKKAGSSGKKEGIKRSLRHEDVPATVGLVKEVRAELKAEIRALDHKVESQINEVKGEINQVKSQLNQVQSQVNKVMASVHRTQVLMEEQRSENKIVLDGIQSVLQRQDRVEEEVRGFRQTLEVLVKAKEGRA